MTNSAGDDALNLKYGHVHLEDNVFEDNASDAVDLDFVTGLVTGNRAERSGGDAFDFSGSSLEVTDNLVVG